MLLFYLYISTITLCLAASVYFKLARQRYLWVYFSGVLFFEFVQNYKLLPEVVYCYSSLFYILFFLNLYQTQIRFNKIVIVFLNLVLLSTGIYFNLDSEHFSISLGILMSLIYISLTLIWFFGQLQNSDEDPLFKKQFFWISSALLIWSVFFIFRLIPMNYFNIHDHQFLQTLNLIFQLITIFTYILFLKALSCKK